METPTISFLLKKKANLPDLTSFRYLLSVPPTYSEDNSKHWPLLLFLHGSGESGDDIELIKNHGVPRLVQVYENLKNGKLSKDDLITENPKTEVLQEKDSSHKPVMPINLECAKTVAENFITLSPQVDPMMFGSGWDSQSLGLLIDQIEKDYRVDKERIYVTGLSMGGFGAFYLAASFPERFAAILPICGGMDVKQVHFIKDVPMWIFHGKKDQIVNIKQSQKIVRALEEMGRKVEFTIYENADHDSWTETYNNPEIYQWLLRHKKSNDQSSLNKHESKL